MTGGTAAVTVGRLPMTAPRAAERLRLAEARCLQHTSTCPVCGPPAPDRSTGRCRQGLRLALAYSAAWRSAIDGLTRLSAQG